MVHLRVDGVLPPREQIPLFQTDDPTGLLLLTDSFRPDDSEWFRVEDFNRVRQRVRPLSVRPNDRHGGRMNAVFGDGHARSVHWAAQGENDPDSFEAQWERWSDTKR